MLYVKHDVCNCFTAKVSVSNVKMEKSEYAFYLFIGFWPDNQKRKRSRFWILKNVENVFSNNGTLIRACILTVRCVVDAVESESQHSRVSQSTASEPVQQCPAETRSKWGSRSRSRSRSWWVGRSIGQLYGPRWPLGLPQTSIIRRQTVDASVRRHGCCVQEPLCWYPCKYTRRLNCMW